MTEASENYRHHKAKEFAKDILANPDKISEDLYAALRVIATDMGTTVWGLAQFVLDRYDGKTLSDCAESYGKSDRYLRATETHFIRLANGEN